MRKLIILLLLLTCVSAYEIKGVVNDYANVLGDHTSSIEAKLQHIKDSGQAEFAVVTVPSLDGEDIEGYSFKLAEGVLGDKEKNNGLLLLVAVDDHKYRFEVGRGLEPILPDITVGRIGREFLVPNFKDEDYGEGVEEAVDAVTQILGGEELPEPEVTAQDLTVFFIVLFVFFAFFTWGFFCFVASIAYAIRGGKRKTTDGRIWRALFWIALWQRRHGGGGGGWSGGGGFSGGGGGFGGGSFGGGGSSGGW